MTSRKTVITYIAGAYLGASCYILDIDKYRIAVDVGLDFGMWDDDTHESIKRAYKRHVVGPDFEDAFFADKKIDAVFLTHNHLDHCGGVTLVLKYMKAEAKVWAMPITSDALSIVLRDTQKRSSYLFKDGPFEVDEVLCRREHLHLGENEPLPGLKMFIKSAGHLPGAASFIFDLGGDERGMITGDVALHDQPIISGMKLCSVDVPSEWMPTRILGTDLTHGELEAKFDYEHEMQRFLAAVACAWDRGAKIAVAAFAWGRGQNVALRLAQEGYPVYVDGLIVPVMQTYADHMPFDFDNLENIHLIESDEHREFLLRGDGPCIVVTTSGMAELGSPIITYLDVWIEDPNNAIFFTSYLTPSSIGGRLLKESRIRKENPLAPRGKNDFLADLEKFAEIDRFHLSAHIDVYGLVEYLKDIVTATGVRLRSIALTHGTPKTLHVAKKFFADLADKVFYPRKGEQIIIEIPDDADDIEIAS